MSLGKKDIVKNISTKAHLNYQSSSFVLDKFLSFIKENKNIKISNFGVFRTHKTKSRIGRNPITKEEYPIPEIKKLTFKSSNKVKLVLN